MSLTSPSLTIEGGSRIGKDSEVTPEMCKSTEWLMMKGCRVQYQRSVDSANSCRSIHTPKRTTALGKGCHYTAYCDGEGYVNHNDTTWSMNQRKRTRGDMMNSRHDAATATETIDLSSLSHLTVSELLGLGPEHNDLRLPSPIVSRNEDAWSSLLTQLRAVCVLARASHLGRSAATQTEVFPLHASTTAVEDDFFKCACAVDVRLRSALSLP
jgi:hypothetical protein